MRTREKVKNGHPKVWVSRRFDDSAASKKISKAWENEISSLDEVQIISHQISTGGNYAYSFVTIAYQEWSFNEEPYKPIQDD